MVLQIQILEQRRVARHASFDDLPGHGEIRLVERDLKLTRVRVVRLDAHALGERVAEDEEPLDARRLGLGDLRAPKFQMLISYAASNSAVFWRPRACGMNR